MYLLDLQSHRNKWPHNLATEWKGSQDTLEESKRGIAFIPIICSNRPPPFLVLLSLWDRKHQQQHVHHWLFCD